MEAPMSKKLKRIINAHPDNAHAITLAILNRKRFPFEVDLPSGEKILLSNGFDNKYKDIKFE